MASDARAPSEIPLDALDTFEAVRIAVILLDREIAKLAAHVENNGKTSQAVRAELADLRARQSMLISRLDSMSDDRTPKTVSWVSDLFGDWFDRFKEPGAAKALRLLGFGLVLGLVTALGFVAWDHYYWWRTQEERRTRAAETEARAAQREAATPDTPDTVERMDVETDNVNVTRRPNPRTP